MKSILKFRNILLMVLSSLWIFACTKSGNQTTDAPAPGSEYSVFAWNDLGRHCLNPGYDKLVILPPYNNELTVDKVTAQAANSGIVLNAAPNPTSGSTIITYTLPEAGRVTLGLYTQQGKAVMSPFINNQSMAAGTFTFNANVSSLARGTYYLTLTLRTTRTTMVKTIKFVRN